MTVIVECSVPAKHFYWIDNGEHWGEPAAVLFCRCKKSVLVWFTLLLERAAAAAYSHIPGAQRGYDRYSGIAGQIKQRGELVAHSSG